MSPLTNEDKEFLLRLARGSLQAAVLGRKMDFPAGIPTVLEHPAGAFVSLHENNDLRGCVGYLLPAQPLYRTVIDAAAAAALKDPRFRPVRPAELSRLEVEISVLSPCREVGPEEVEVGVHGLMITQDRRRGVLLPQVAIGHRWDREWFLEETCRKAGLPVDAWRRGARIEAFAAEVFREELAGRDAQRHSSSLTEH